MGAPRRARRVRDRRRRGLRVLLWLACLFWASQVLGGLVLDYLWARPRYPSQWQMYDRLQARAHAPEIFFFGSSRFEGGINCAVVDAELRRQLGARAPRAFNAALPAADPTVFERVYQDIMKRGFRPRMLVVEISPETVSDRNPWLYQQALTVLDWRDVSEALAALCANGKIMYLFRGRFLPLYLHRYHIRQQALALVAGLFHPRLAPAKTDPPVLPPVTKDPQPLVLTTSDRARMEAAYPVMTHGLANYHPGGIAAHRLERLLECCRCAGVPVLLVGVPVTSPYRRAYTAQVDAAFLGYVHELTASYGCVYSDWRDKVADAYFRDEHHLCPAGGVYFSRRLTDRVLAPLIRQMSASSMPLARRAQ
jgi:hypothetical protein